MCSASAADPSIGQFDFHLPDRLIAQYPAQERTLSRLLVVEQRAKQFREMQFSELLSLFRPGDLLICNDSRVIPARLFARKPTGGKVEILVERIDGDRRLQAQMKARRPLKVGERVTVNERFELMIAGRKRDLFVLETDPGVHPKTVVQTCGSVPLPPYINRPLEDDDRERYQTVYASSDGSVAAPTAGLHFSNDLLAELCSYGVDIQYVTLHVGAGTFAPIRADDISRHSLHSERCEIKPSVCDAVSRAKSAGARIVAVGTTAVRALESAALAGDLEPYFGETDLFIKPGFKFRVVDALITNFHLPKSTLLMLVCAFGGVQPVLEAYRQAVEREFRFYSYGDAMYLECAAVA